MPTGVTADAAVDVTAAAVVAAFAAATQADRPGRAARVPSGVGAAAGGFHGDAVAFSGRKVTSGAGDLVVVVAKTAAAAAAAAAAGLPAAFAAATAAPAIAALMTA